MRVRVLCVPCVCVGVCANQLKGFCTRKPETRNNRTFCAIRNSPPKVKMKIQQSCFSDDDDEEAIEDEIEQYTHL